MVSRTLCISALILGALLLAAGCTSTDSGSAQSASATPTSSADPILGNWVQTGNASLLIRFSDGGNALLRFRMPNTETLTYNDVSGTWVRSGMDEIRITYTAPVTNTEKTILLLFDTPSAVYVDRVFDQNGTVIGDPNTPKEEKLRLVRAGSGQETGSLSVMAISTLPAETITLKPE